MPRPLWKGSISFGLVNIPVTLHGAVTPETLRFRQIDRRSKAPVKEKRVSERTGQEVPWDDVVKGYEYEDGRYVLLEDDELRQANVKATQTIDIVQFARREEIDPLYFETPYYVAPTKGGAKGYALLREALRSSDRVGIAKVVVRFRQHMAALMPEGRLLVLELLRYGHEIRDAADLEVPGDDLTEIGVGPREVAMAELLVQSMEEPWRPQEFHDEYRDARAAAHRREGAGGRRAGRGGERGGAGGRGRRGDRHHGAPEAQRGAGRRRSGVGRRRREGVVGTGGRQATQAGVSADADSLGEYRRKRRFEKTPEPAGEAPGSPGPAGGGRRLARRRAGGARLRDPQARRPPPALRPAAGAGRRPEELGGAQRAQPGPVPEAPGDARRGPSDRLRPL